MEKMSDWTKLSKCLSYWELCCIEQALNNFFPSYLTDYDKEKFEKLKDTVASARGWQHHLNKTER